MIDFYTWWTPNGYEIRIMLEESGLAYELHPVNLGTGEQKKPEYLAINPNGKIPAIIDRDGPGGRELRVFESGAILLYLAEKSGKLLPEDPGGRWKVIPWLMFQASAVGPYLGQAGYFRNRAPEKVPLAIEKFSAEAVRIFGVLEGQLGESEFLAGEYSIADIACFPWIRMRERFGIEIGNYPNVKRWLQVISARPAVQRGLETPS
jgi:GST-like protein